MMVRQASSCLFLLAALLGPVAPAHLDGLPDQRIEGWRPVSTNAKHIADAVDLANALEASTLLLGSCA